MTPQLESFGLRLACASADMRAMPKQHSHDQIRFIAPLGTRAFYRSAAELAGKDWKMWARDVLHKAAIEEHARRGVEYENPPEAQPTLPPPLQDRRR